MARGQIIPPVGGMMWPVGGIFSRSRGRGGIITLLHGRADTLSMVYKRRLIRDTSWIFSNFKRQ